MESLLRTTQHLPPTLYRIDYGKSQTAFTPSEGFIASNPSAPPLLESDSLRAALTSHASWARVASPFISMFADERHARNWALARGDGSVRMVVIDTTYLLGRRVVVRAVDAYRKFGIQVPAKAWDEDEYLCLNQIPAAAVVRVIGYKELVDAQREQIEARLEQQQHLWRVDNDPLYHYDVEFGWHDPDDETELRNTNDDIMKVIEGDW